MTVPVEVILRDGTGEIARAEATPGTAEYTAGQLKRDARAAWPIQGYCRTLSVAYVVDGRTVRVTS